MSKKTVFIYLLLIILFGIIIFLSTQIVNLNKQYDETVVTFKESFNNIDYSSSLNSLHQELEALKKNCEADKNFSDKMDNINLDIAELHNKYDSMPDYSEEINKLNSKINTLENKISSTVVNEKNNKPIGKWQSVVLDYDYTQSHTSEKYSFTTIYEFGDNGEFYINGNKTGTFKNNYIIFKDSNDPSFRIGYYFYIDTALYINLYMNKIDIVLSSDLYECNKI